MDAQTLRPWLGPASSYGPSMRFWTPAAHVRPLPYLETRKLAAKLPKLTRYQWILLRKAAARPWDPVLQARAMAALLNTNKPLFPPLPCETPASISDIARLRDKPVVFVPKELPVPEAAKELLKTRFVRHGNSGKVAVYVSLRLHDRHELDVAQTGTGKTVQAQHRFRHAPGSGKWAFIHGKSEEWIGLIPELGRSGITPAFPRMLKINPVAPIGNPLRSKEWFVERFCANESAPPFSRDVLDMAIDPAYQRFGAYTNPLPLDVNPTIQDIILEIEKLDRKKIPAGVISTLIVRLRAWERQFGSWAKPWSIEELGRRTILFPFSDWSTKSAQIAVETLQGGLFASREGRITSERTFVLHEEGQLVFGEKSGLLMAEDIALFRAEGIQIQCLVQSTRRLSPIFLENAAIKSLGPVGHPKIATQMAAAMSLQPEHFEVLRAAPIGTFIETYAQGVNFPVLVRCPFRALQQPTPMELYEAEHALDDLPAVSREEAHRIEIHSGNGKVDKTEQELPPEATEFLLGVHERPFLGIVDRFRYHGFNARHGNNLKTQCVERELVEERRVPLGTGGTRVLLQLTSKAQTLLGLSEINRQVVHSYAAHLVMESCAQNGARVMAEVDGLDVLVEAGDQAIAVEIEVSGTNAEKNLDRNLERYDWIIIVAVGHAALKQLRRRLHATLAALPAGKRITLCTLGQVLESDRPIWKWPDEISESNTHVSSGRNST